MKRCLLYALSFVLSLTALFTVFSGNVSAASEYDDWARQTNILKAQDFNRNVQNSDDGSETISNWRSFIDDRSKWGAPGLNAPTEVEYQSLTDAIADENYVVIVTTSGEDTENTVKLIDIYWSNDEISASWSADAIAIQREPGAVRGNWQIRITAPPGVFTFDEARIASGGLNSWGVQRIGGKPGTYWNSPAHYIEIYESRIANPNYPAGYEGPQIGITTPGSTTTSKRPNITWEVDDYDVTFYSDDEKNTANLPEDYLIMWYFSNTTFDTVQPSEPFALSGCTDPETVNEYTVPVYFDYGLQAYYADKDCNILSKDLDGTSLVTQMVVLNIDGGTYSGSTETDSDYIEENKLVGAIKNISVDQHGLQTLILAPAQLFAQVATWDGSCSTISMPFIQGKTLELQCIRSGFSTQYPVIYGTIQVVFGGLIAYFVAIRTFAVIKGANDPQDDKVETYKL